MAKTAAVVDGGFADLVFRTTALAVATRQLTKSKWEDHSNGITMNALYTIAFWKQPPGGVGIDQAAKQTIRQYADAHYARMWERFMATTASEGYPGVIRYLKECVATRDKAQADLKWFFEQVAADNREAMAIAAQGIKTFAAVKLASTIGLAACGLGGAYVLSGGAAWIATGISVGGSMSCSIAKNWSEKGSVEAIGIDFQKENGKFWVDKGVTTIADHNAQLAVAEIDSGQQALKAADKTLAKESKRIGKRASSKGTRQAMATAQAERQAAQQTIGRGTTRGTAAKVGQVTGKIIPVAFFAWEVFDAVGEYNETTKGL
jgi:hypothetical protein